MTSIQKVILVLAVSVGAASCTGGQNQTNIDNIQDMMDQINVKAQDWDPSRPDMRANMLPPEGTYARGYNPLRATDADDAGAKWKNPLADNFSPQIIERGKAKFDIYCAVCHGALGHGDGPVSSKFIIPVPKLITDQVKGYPDGKIMYFVTNGKGLMGQYAGQIPKAEDRWAVINYVRTLQRPSNQ